MNQTCKLLLFDLDGTLLRSDKSISEKTLSVLNQCREKGILIGVSTSRSEQNSMTFLNELMPDILISSGGALVKDGIDYIYKAEFSEFETRNMITMAITVCGEDCEITIDTTNEHYWNYKIEPKKLDQSWGDSIYTDFTDFSECALKMCVEIFDEEKANILVERLEQCDCIRFSDGYWYKFTKKNVTKENAITRITEVYGFGTESIIAFGDDFADIGMLELCGLGVAMGNAIDEVKNRADIVIGSNDEEGIAFFIEENLLTGIL
ncbi:Cof-type HAD-IIB family hydrolase [Anaerosporobacter sp.]